jgi:hypothetical protein
MRPQHDDFIHMGTMRLTPAISSDSTPIVLRTCADDCFSEEEDDTP